MIAVTTTALAFPDPDGFDRDALNREWHELVREVGATLGDPMTADKVRSDLLAIVDTRTVFVTRKAPDQQTRADLKAVFNNPPPVGQMEDRVFRTAMNSAYRNGREVA